MSTFSYFWNRIYYSLYCILCFISHSWGNVLKMILCRPLYSIPFVRRRLAMYGFTYETWIEYVLNFWENPKSGMQMFFLNGAITYIVLLLILLFINILYCIFGIEIRILLFDNLELCFIILGVLSISFCQNIIWKKDSYLNYFSHFEKESRKKKTVWCIGTILLTVLLTIITFLTFWYAEVKNGLWH